MWLLYMSFYEKSMGLIQFIYMYFYIGETMSIWPFLKNNVYEAPEGPFSGMDSKEEFLQLKRHCIIALRIQKMNAAFLSLDHLYISINPTFSHRQPIKKQCFHSSETCVVFVM